MRIPLTQGKYAIIDRWGEAAGRPPYLGEGDDPTLIAGAVKFKWRAEKKGDTWYAVTTARISDGRWKKYYLHHFVMGRKPGEKANGREADHINRDGLDNRAANLRECTRSQNQANRKQEGGSSEFKGVHLNKRSGDWQASIRLDGKTKHLGTFSCGIDRCLICGRSAGMTYDWYAVRKSGEFARINFPDIDHLAMPEPPRKGRRKEPHTVEESGHSQSTL